MPITNDESDLEELSDRIERWRRMWDGKVILFELKKAIYNSILN
jgi:hypothetical protein